MQFFNFTKFFLIINTINSLLYGQWMSISNELTLPFNRINYQFINTDNFSSKTGKINKSKFYLSFRTQVIANNGHSNIDNNGAVFSNSQFSNFHSFKIYYKNPWLFIELEPFIYNKHNIFAKNKVFHSFQYLNNHTSSPSISSIKQSHITFNLFGLGASYGKKTHWWSPAIHNAIVLSSNSGSQETFSLGTFNPLKYRNFIFNGEIIVMPYKSIDKNQLYFSGLRSSIAYDSNPKVEVGFFRTFLSAGVNLTNTNFEGEWSIYDATRLVFEPLLGQSKKNLDYTIIGTPGFDRWDELLSGYISVFFPKDNINIYIELASDDNRGNFTDLRAHWDHTLAYTIGLNKQWDNFYTYKIFFGLEYFTNRTSNTFNSEFYRGNPNVINYYSKSFYDFFTYNGRRMGAHSGSSSSDLYFILGIQKNRSSSFISLSREMHGIKSMTNPEIKSELSFTYQFELSTRNKVFATIESEHISNFEFYQNKYSRSSLAWFGYVYTFGKIN